MVKACTAAEVAELVVRRARRATVAVVAKPPAVRLTISSAVAFHHRRVGSQGTFAVDPSGERAGERGERCGDRQGVRHASTSTVQFSLTRPTRRR